MFCRPLTLVLALVLAPRLTTVDHDCSPRSRMITPQRPLADALVAPPMPLMAAACVRDACLPSCASPQCVRGICFAPSNSRTLLRLTPVPPSPVEPLGAARAAALPLSLPKTGLPKADTDSSSYCRCSRWAYAASLCVEISAVRSIEDVGLGAVVGVNPAVDEEAANKLDAVVGATLGAIAGFDAAPPKKKFLSVCGGRVACA